MMRATAFVCANESVSGGSIIGISISIITEQFKTRKTIEPQNLEESEEYRKVINGKTFMTIYYLTGHF